MRDMNGKEFTEGCRFIKPSTRGRSAFLAEHSAHIKEGKLYADSSKVAIWYPERCYILPEKQ